MIRRGAAPSDRFTIVPNDYLRDVAISWGARGLLAWLMSHMAGFEVTEAGIINAGPSGRDGVRSLVRELEEHGYLKRERTYTPEGGSAVDYTLVDPRATGKPSAGKDGEAVVQPGQGSNDRPDKEPAGQGPNSPNDGKGVTRSSVEDQEKTKKTSSSKKTTPKATRIPDDFQPDEQMRAWYRENIGSVINGAVEHEKFCDYWRAAPGARGQKVDWPATWRNWMRTAAERHTPRPWQPGQLAIPTSGAPYRPSTTDQRVAQGLSLAAHFREEETA